MNGQLTVEELILSLREKVADGVISNTDTVMWNHREWGYVAVTDIVKLDPDALGDMGLVNCCALIPAKFVPKEKGEGCYKFTIHSVPSNMKIAAIKALRCVLPDIGLKEAKDIIESCPFVYTGTTHAYPPPPTGLPYVIDNISPNKIVSFKETFGPITGLKFSIECDKVGDVGDMYVGGW